MPRSGLSTLEWGCRPLMPLKDVLHEHPAKYADACSSASVARACSTRDRRQRYSAACCIIIRPYAPKLTVVRYSARKATDFPDSRSRACHRAAPTPLSRT